MYFVSGGEYRIQPRWLKNIRFQYGNWYKDSRHRQKKQRSDDVNRVKLRPAARKSDFHKIYNKDVLIKSWKLVAFVILVGYIFGV